MVVEAVRRDAITKIGVGVAMALGVLYVHATLGSPFSASRTTTDNHAKPHWSYVGSSGPASWGNLSSGDGPLDYRMCTYGREQSPVGIILDSSYIENVAQASFQYADELDDTITNNGHTVKVSTGTSGFMRYNGTRFRLLQFHFHSPSEHKFDGLSYPLEMHMVHTDDAGNVLVFALLFQLSASPSAFLEQFWLPKLPALGEVRGVNVSFTPLTAELQSRSFLTYAGSFTTPPCTEGVRWVIADQAFGMSAQQMDAFLAIEGHDGCSHNCIIGNNRPVQPLYGRAVYRGSLADEGAPPANSARHANVA